MKIHNMKLYPEYFEQVRTGEKIREYRLYDEKRKQIKIGDMIIFQNTANLDETVSVLVEEISTFNSFFEMYNSYFDLDFKEQYKSVDDVVTDTYPIYTKEQQEEYGGVCFKIKKLK